MKIINNIKIDETKQILQEIVEDATSIDGDFNDEWNRLENDKIARLTGEAIQDDETFKSEGGFVPERDQYYFKMQQGDNVFLIGFKDMLISLRLLEKLGEIPKVGEKWWMQIASLYGNDILMIELEE